MPPGADDARRRPSRRHRNMKDDSLRAVEGRAHFHAFYRPRREDKRIHLTPFLSRARRHQRRGRAIALDVAMS